MFTSFQESRIRSQIGTIRPMIVMIVLHLVAFLPILKAQVVFKDKEDLLTCKLSNHSLIRTQRKPKPELQETSVIASDAFSIFIS